MTCLPCKEEIDNGMGRIAARFYGRVGSGTPVHVAAAQFYEDGVTEIFGPLASKLLTMKLTDEQTAELMVQIDKQCYRADDLIVRGLALDGANSTQIDAWTAELLAWAKNDQAFYTALAAEVKG